MSAAAGGGVAQRPEAAHLLQEGCVTRKPPQLWRRVSMCICVGALELLDISYGGAVLRSQGALTGLIHSGGSGLGSPTQLPGCLPLHNRSNFVVP